MATILDAIKRAIMASDKSRYRLAKETGISEAALSRLMSGKRGLSVKSVESLAIALDLSIAVRPRKGRRKKNKR